MHQIKSALNEESISFQEINEELILIIFPHCYHCYVGVRSDKAEITVIGTDKCRLSDPGANIAMLLAQIFNINYQWDASLLLLQPTDVITYIKRAQIGLIG
jgi:hypothetical protein